MPHTTPTTPPPPSAALPDGPVLPDLAALTECLALSEQMLLDWMRRNAAAPAPPSISDLNQSTQALARLTSVHKTLLLIPKLTPPANPDDEGGITDEMLEEIIRNLEYHSKPAPRR